jgi:hypothetical protein
MREHLARTGEKVNACSILFGASEGNIPTLERLKSRWKDSIEIELKGTEYVSV